ncbi:MAG TPA: acetyl-CoA C-acyltransferase [Gemmatimonadales bacterium]|nr:acetyl-CoA C-acyltransferase [Gemmatimonadales bacterium]
MPAPSGASSPRDSEVVFLSGVRTGFGTFGGSLKDHSATDLAAVAATEAIARAGIAPADVDHVVFGNVLQTSADAPYLARHVGLRAGVPLERPALTVNRLCGSGFEAVIQAAQQIRLGESRVVLAGGSESMSQAPHVVRGARWGLKFGAPPPLQDTLWEAVRDAYCGLMMGETAENLAERYRIPREEVDCYAARSQACARAAWEAGAFADEVIRVPVRDRRTRRQEPWAQDEHMRPDTTPEALAKLAPVFKEGGVVTAGNASGISDGAAALVVASGAWARERGLRPIGRLVAWASAGVDPSYMGIGPVPAARLALERAGLALERMDLVEVNEAFAAQYLAVERELGLDRDRTNVDGGAVALGHPLGASGARITLHLLHALRRRGGRYGLGSACVGGGQGVAVVVEAGT